jgi:hypothetical protein
MNTVRVWLLIGFASFVLARASTRGSDEVGELPGLDHVLLWRDLILALDGLANSESHSKAQREYIGSQVVPLVFKAWISLGQAGREPMENETFREFAKPCYGRALPYYKKFMGEQTYLRDPLNILRFYEGGTLRAAGVEMLQRRDIRNLHLDEKFRNEIAYQERVSAFHKDLGIPQR